MKNLSTSTFLSILFLFTFNDSPAQSSLHDWDTKLDSLYSLKEYNTVFGYADQLIKQAEKEQETINPELASNDPFDPSTIGGVNAVNLVEEPNGDFWVGTDNFTLNYFDREQQRFFRFQPEIPTKGIMSYQKAGFFGEIATCPVNPG